MMYGRGNLPLILLLVAVIGVSGSAAYGQSVVAIEADRDNTLFESPSGTISNGEGQHLFVGRVALQGGGLVRRAVLHFDVAGAVPAGATIQSALLSMNMSKSISGNQTVTVHRLLSDWGEGASNATGQEGTGTAAMANDATWIHTFFSGSFWGATGGDFDASASASQTVGTVGPYLWGPTAQLTADVQVWLDNPADNFGWIAIGNEAVMTTAKRFDSKDHPVSSNRPILTITYTTPVVSCCEGRTGDANKTGGDTPTVADIAVIINQLFGDGSPVACLDEADADISGTIQNPPLGPEDLSVSDISFIIDELFGEGTPLPQCP